MKKKTREIIILIQVILAVFGSLYYGRYGDIVKDFINGSMFHRWNGYIPCELCRFARILMYPILPISIIWIYNKSKEYVNYIIPLSIIWILLELYQYYFQMVNNKGTVKAVICWANTWANCAATDVIYLWFITIPFLCLLAFVVILISCYFIKKSDNTNNIH